MEKAPEKKGFNVYDLWERFGFTRHIGGFGATRRLIELCKIEPGQLVLDIGCGTGYTASLLAKEYGVRVVGIDMVRKNLTLARERAVREGVSDKVEMVRADARNLPFKADVFDAAIAESVLVFCDPPERAASEAYRVLKPGGMFGDNELTYLQPPPERLRVRFAQLVSGIAGKLLSEDMLREQWEQVRRAAGFADVASEVYPMKRWEQFTYELRVSGLRQFLSAISQLIFDPYLRAAYLNKDVLQLLFQLPPYVGYGLYTGRKPDRSVLR